MEDLLDKYFEKNLSDEEQEKVNDLLEHNAEFRAEWEFRRNLKIAVHNQERKELKNLVKGFERKKTGSFVYWLAAASVLVIGGLLVLQLVFQNPDREKLYVAYFEPFPNMVMPNVRGEENELPYAEAFKLYDKHQYAEAARKFNEFGKTYGIAYLSFYEGVSWLTGGTPARGIEIFEGTEYDDAQLPLETYRKWYLALAYLKTGQSEKSKKELKDLATSENPQKEKATELLKALE